MPGLVDRRLLLILLILTEDIHAEKVSRYLSSYNPGRGKVRKVRLKYRLKTYLRGENTVKLRMRLFTARVISACVCVAFS